MKPNLLTQIKENRSSSELGSTFVEAAVVLALIATIVVGTVREVGHSSGTTLESLHSVSGADSSTGHDPEEEINFNEQDPDRFIGQRGFGS